MSYNERGIENEADQKTTLLVVQRIDRRLVILDKDHAINFGQEMGSKDPMFGRRRCT